MLTTERDYIRDLKAVISGYLCKCSPILNTEDLETIFCNLEEIYDLHVELLKDVSFSRQWQHLSWPVKFHQYSSSPSSSSSWSLLSGSPLRLNTC